MIERFEIVFETKGPEQDERVIREYITPAVERLEDQGILEEFHFFRYGGQVKFRLYGRRDDIESSERSRWNELEGEFIDSWSMNSYSLEVEKYGEQGARLANSCFELASRTSLRFLDEFEKEKPDAVNTYPGENGLPSGSWLLIHPLFNQLSYGNEGEIDACFQALQNRIQSVAENESPESAERVIENIQSALDQLSGSLDRLD